MDGPPILPDPAALRLVCLEAGSEGIAVVARAVARRAPCPACGTASGRVHPAVAPQHRRRGLCRTTRSVPEPGRHLIPCDGGRG